MAENANASDLPTSSGSRCEYLNAPSRFPDLTALGILEDDGTDTGLLQVILSKGANETLPRLPKEDWFGELSIIDGSVTPFALAEFFKGNRDSLYDLMILGTDVTGPMFEEIPALRSLRKLIIDLCDDADALSAGLFKHEALEDLFLKGTSVFLDKVSPRRPLPNLRELTIESEQSCLTELGAISHFPSLERLSVAVKELDLAAYRSISLSTTRHLSLLVQSLSAEGVELLLSSRTLKELSLDCPNKFVLPSSVPAQPVISWLNLDSQTSPGQLIAFLQHCPNLSTLYLRIPDFDINADLPALTQLPITDLMVSSKIPLKQGTEQWLKEFRGLRELRMFMPNAEKLAPEIRGCIPQNAILHTG